MRRAQQLLLMMKILHYLKDPKLWELWHIPSYGYCRIYTINRIYGGVSHFGLSGCSESMWSRDLGILQQQS